MVWRLARSLVKLQSELDAAYPNRTRPDWTIGDAAHRRTWSDHNPNASNVVCAIDIRQGGINLNAVAEQIKRTNNLPVKYVIWNRRIWSKVRNAEGWRSYGGSNPHTTHIHVSVGVGPDGRSIGPYNSQAGWGISSTGPTSKSFDDGVMDMVGLKRGDKGLEVVFLQIMLRYAGFGHLLGNTGEDKNGVDGHYGPATSRAVLATRKYVGSSVTSGDLVTVWGAAQIYRAVARREAE